MDKRSSIPGIRGFRTDQAGSTAVEFAILAPLHVFLIMGMSAYGIYFGASHSVQQLAADAARAAVAGIGQAERERLATTFIDRNAGGYLFIDPNGLTIDIGDSAADPTQFDVTVSYDAARLPIWNLHERLSTPQQTIRRRATIRIGGI